LVLLVCARLMMYPWASDRLASWTTARRVGAAVVLSGGLIGLGLWYRVAEVPDVAEPPDLEEFEASLPSPEENEAGQLVRGACSRLEDLSRQWSALKPTKPLFPTDTGASFSQQARLVFVYGWPEGRPELAGFLDTAFAEDWWKRLAEAAKKPVGVVEDPRRLTMFASKRSLGPAQLAGVLLAARGLQMQKMKGDSSVFVDHFAAGLALASNLRNHSDLLPVLFARDVETVQLQALERWLERPPGRPDLLRRAAQTLRRYQETLPATETEGVRLAEYLIARGTLANPQEWLDASLGNPGENRAYEPALVQAAWTAPWEHTRQRRLLRALFFEPSGVSSSPSFERRLAANVTLPRMQGLKGFQKRRKARLAAAELMLALRRYQAEAGKPAESLDVLTPRYLRRIPTDPFDGLPFRYRLSQGEEIAWPEEDPAAGPAAQGGVAPGGPRPDWLDAQAEPKRRIPPGQGILWSVGEDGHDDGGKRQGLFPGNQATRPGEDLIFLVPL
jgi:type II secretory pathway pseudopilin PulG